MSMAAKLNAHEIRKVCCDVLRDTRVGQLTIETEARTYKWVSAVGAASTAAKSVGRGDVETLGRQSADVSLVYVRPDSISSGSDPHLEHIAPARQRKRTKSASCFLSSIV
jgi:hypothetical protein